ncbi:MAG: adenylate/guanylate cyclase domain-containing protein [Deltaproteobacteria bacterium]|nr:adenylate/guanylate cyclase domain-containing protein [Deltaproteobacteria bacterium]
MARSKLIPREVWFVHAPIIAVWTFLFLVVEWGAAGTLQSPMLRALYPRLQPMSGWATDVKFRLRGPRQPGAKIVMVDIDEEAIEQVGRWPWHRDFLAGLIQSAFDAGAKVVGLDIVFSEPDVRVPDGVAELLRAHDLGDQIPRFETDLLLQRVIALHRDQLVLGWMNDDWCIPATDVCSPAPALPKGFEKFAYGKVQGSFDQAKTGLIDAPTIIANIDGFDEAAAHSGYLLGWPDADDVTRKTFLAVTSHGRVFPSLPLEMARVGLGDELALSFDAHGWIERIGLERTSPELPVSSRGAMAINFLGPGYHQGVLPWVPAMQLLGDDAQIQFVRNAKVETAARDALFKDAYVFIGLSAQGVNDLRNFPFGPRVPGVEGQATVLENLLSNQTLRTGVGAWSVPLLLLMMTLGALAFALALRRLEALPAMLCFVGVVAVLALADGWLLFARHRVNLNSVFFFGELASLFVATLAVNYVLEERSKKFIRGAFSKYLAPAVVDQMLQDPARLSLGGENRRLTIMMSDLRGFTAMAERLKPEQVLGVLNHYLGTMADIIVEHDGTIDEFIGDAILVIFGAPIARPDDARRAVACSVAMQRAMKDINAHNAAQGLPKIEMGIALNTGEVIVGNIGSQKHIKYGVVGSHVNLTARIESNTVGGQVLISASTLELAGADLKLGEKQMIVAKGFPEPIAAHEVLGLGGEYNLFLEEVNLALVGLESPVEVKLRVMKSKNEEGPELSGRFRALSALGATLECDGTGLEAFKNLKMRIVGPSDELVEGDLYAKVTAGGASATLRFTAVPPAVASFVEKRLEKQAPGRTSDLAQRG